MIKNIFNFMLKELFFLQIIIVVSYLSIFHLFCYVEKRFVKKVKLNFKIYDVTAWAINNYKTHIAQYLKK